MEKIHQEAVFEPTEERFFDGTFQKDG